MQEADAGQGTSVVYIVTSDDLGDTWGHPRQINAQVLPLSPLRMFLMKFADFLISDKRNIDTFIFLFFYGARYFECCCCCCYNHFRLLQMISHDIAQSSVVHRHFRNLLSFPLSCEL